MSVVIKNKNKNAALSENNGPCAVVGNWLDSHMRPASWLVKFTVIKLKVNQYLATGCSPYTCGVHGKLMMVFRQSTLIFTIVADH